MISQINVPLFRLNSKGVIEPFLATGGSKISKDQLEYTVAIRHNVVFSNGRPLTAKDVVFSLNQARKSPYYESLYETFTGVKAVSPYEVVITSSEPVAAMKADLSLYLAGIVPDHYLGESAQEFGQHPIGTGPFVLKKWVHGQYVEMTRNQHYWQAKRPLLNGVVFRVDPEGSSRVAQLRGGQLDVIKNTPKAQVASIEDGEGMMIVPSFLNYVNLMLLNSKTPLFHDPRVRQAVNLAVDRKGIINAATGGQGKPAGSFLVPSIIYWDRGIEPPGRDVARAKELLTEVIEETGISPSFTLISWSGETYSSTASQIIQQDLDEVGFEVKLKPLELYTALEQVESGEFEAAMHAYFSGSPDPSELTTFFSQSLAAPSGMDITKISELAKEGAAELNPKKREEIYFQIQEIVAEQENAIMLDYEPEVWAQSSSVVGMEVTPTNYLWLMDTGFSS